MLFSFIANVVVNFS